MIKYLKFIRKKNLSISKKDLIFFNKTKYCLCYTIGKDMKIQVFKPLIQKLNLYIHKHNIIVLPEQELINDLVILDQDLRILKKSLINIKKFNL